MANDLNKIIIIGRLTNNPELKYIQNGSAVANFSIANNKSFTQNGEKKDQVSFFNCVAWSKLAELICQYCKKGDRIGIEGKLQQRSWEKEGKKNYIIEIVVENIQFLSEKQYGMETKTEFKQVPNEPKINVTPANIPNFDDLQEDIPF